MIELIPSVKISDTSVEGHSGITEGLLSVAKNGRSVTAPGSDATIGSHSMLISPLEGYLRWQWCSCAVSTCGKGLIPGSHH